MIDENFLNEVEQRIQNAKLSSDDHGHDCSILREYCERELIWAYDVLFPDLIKLARLGLWARDVGIGALKHTVDFCLCGRNTTGFDYGEIHPQQGKPKVGSRWLTPECKANYALSKLPKQTEEKDDRQ